MLPLFVHKGSSTGDETCQLKTVSYTHHAKNTRRPPLNAREHCALHLLNFPQTLAKHAHFPLANISNKYKIWKFILLLREAGTRRLTSYNFHRIAEHIQIADGEERCPPFFPHPVIAARKALRQLGIKHTLTFLNFSETLALRWKDSWCSSSCWSFSRALESPSETWDLEM